MNQCLQDVRDVLLFPLPKEVVDRIQMLCKFGLKPSEIIVIIQQKFFTANQKQAQAHEEQLRSEGEKQWPSVERIRQLRALQFMVSYENRAWQTLITQLLMEDTVDVREMVELFNLFTQNGMLTIQSARTHLKQMRSPKQSM
ncbi:hypothetical protein CPBF367_36460 [Xanthomonas arboricola pv. juglandis]|nr:hypothetical protein CPBF367_36460 [Xanthomonas arboricola pv. juglandis]